MKRTKLYNRLLAVALAVCMVVGMIPSTALAAGSVPDVSEVLVTAEEITEDEIDESKEETSKEPAEETPEGTAEETQQVEESQEENAEEEETIEVEEDAEVQASLKAGAPQASWLANNETPDSKVDVTFTLSYDGAILKGCDGTRLNKVSLSIPYFDLAPYGFEECGRHYSEGNGDTNEVIERPTMLHALIYMLERYYYGMDEDECGKGNTDFSDTQQMYDEFEQELPCDLGASFIGAGDVNSFFISGYWGINTYNLVYYRNHHDSLMQYVENDQPDSNGWYSSRAATAPYILLEDGDTIDFGMSSDWNWFNDGGNVYMADYETAEHVVLQEGDSYTWNTEFFGINWATEVEEPGVYWVVYEDETGAPVYEGWEEEPKSQFTYTFDSVGSYTVVGYGENFGAGGITLPAVAKVTVEGKTYETTFAGHSAQLNSFKLYTYEDGVIGTEDLLNGIENSGTGNNTLYRTSLPAGDYWLEGYDANEELNGGIVITVEAKETNAFTVYRIYDIYATNSGWVLGTDYKLSAEVTNPDRSVDRQATFGQATVWGNTRSSCICLNGDTVKITYTPIGENAADYVETFTSKTITVNTNMSAAIPEALLLTFVAPAGSTVDAGKFHTYYIYEFEEPVATGSYSSLTEDPDDDETDSRIYYQFRMPKVSANAVSGPYYFYRVQNPGGVTYWNFFDPKTTATEIEVTEADLFIGSSEFTPATIYHQFEKNTYDMADIYLNANGKGYLNLEADGSYELNVFRNWMAIETFYNRRVALPDMHYTVVDMEGNPSDLLTVTPDEKNSCVAKITANGTSGTAIVLVTYDAMYSGCAYVSGKANQPNQFSAIWPENTGVLVVTVGADGTSIDTGIQIDRLGTEGALDAEHDPLFYVGEEGASYTFTPEEGSTVTVNRAVLTEQSLTFAGFTGEGVTTSDDGAITISGLTTGRHIIRVEKNGLASYQVVTAKQVSYELQDADGNPLESNAQIKAGDTVYVQFTGLTNPCEKLSGVYNHSAMVCYEGEEGTQFNSNPGSVFGGVYDFSSNPQRQRLAITIPKYWSDSTYTLHGAINMRTSGSAPGTHRGITYAKGVNANYNASTGSNILGRLPELTIELAQTDFLAGTLEFRNEKEEAVDRNALNITMKDAENNAIVVKEDGSFQCTPGEYKYVITGAGIQYAFGTVTATEDGSNHFIIHLQSSSEQAWDGVTETEPQKDEDGVYLISNGAELAWFSRQNQEQKSARGKLIADIDLACYPWNNTLTYTNATTVLDGDGHEVINLNAARGLFGALGSNSVVKKLTIRGKLITSASVGAVTGYACGTDVLIENCVNDAEISSTGSNVGGLVGYANQPITIRNCVNRGSVNGASSVGGIIGSTGQAKVLGCYNTGDITGTSYVGGIAGDTNAAAEITGVYNTGRITGNNYVGGLCGRMQGSSYGTGDAVLKEGYNIGIVDGTSYVGGVTGYAADTKVVYENCYYLKGKASGDAGAEVLTKTELKNAQLDSEIFGLTCTGYPALLWQEDVSFHKAAETIVREVAATCTEKGYTVYQCENCQGEFWGDYSEALGHDWCGHTSEEESESCPDCLYTAPTCTEKGSVAQVCRREGCEEIYLVEIPALGHTEDTSKTVNKLCYKDCVCSVCGSTYREWYDERLQHIELDEKNVEEVSVEDSGEYPWVYREENKRLESSNVDVNSSISSTSVKVKLAEESKVSFGYGVSSENNWDKLTITLSPEDGENVTIADGISGEKSDSYEGIWQAGAYTLTFSYAKDSSSRSGSDIGWVQDLKIRRNLSDEVMYEMVDLISGFDAVDKSNYAAQAEAVSAAKEAFESLSTEVQEAFKEQCADLFSKLTDAEAFYDELGLWSDEIPAETYTGKAVKPEIRIYEGLELLELNKDYTVSYKNNTNAFDTDSEGFNTKKAPTAVIKFRRNYTGSIYRYFTIEKIDLTKAAADAEYAQLIGLQIQDVTAAASSKAVYGKPVVTMNGKKVPASEYTLSYPDKERAEDAYKGPGSYAIIITGNGKNFEGSYTAVQNMSNVLMTKVKIASIPSAAVTDEILRDGYRPELTVTYGTGKNAKTLVEGVHYTVTYDSNQAIGTATATITGTGMDADAEADEVPLGLTFLGSKTVKFSITGEKLDSKKVVLNAASKEYAGEAVTLDSTEYSVTNAAGDSLAEDTDYIVSGYKKNTAAGTATVTFQGIGKYYGFVSKTFKITKADVTKADISYLNGGDALTVSYQKGGVKPAEQIQLTCGAYTLVYGKDYQIEWKNHTTAAAADAAKAPMFRVSGKGSFTGKTEWVKFTITPAKLGEQAVMTVKDLLYKDVKNNYKAAVTLTDANGKKLKAGTDYDKNVSYFVYAPEAEGADAEGYVAVESSELFRSSRLYLDGKDELLMKAEAAGKGLYEGTISAAFRIYPYNINKAKVTNVTGYFTYNGSSQEMKYVITYGSNADKIALTEGVDYRVVSEDSIFAGIKRVTVEGMGRFGGTKKVTYQIKAWDAADALKGKDAEVTARILWQ